MEHKLKISHFKELYKSLKTPFPPINFLILGMLIGLEQRWINLKSEQTVTDAIEKYMVEHPDTVYEAVVEECEDGGIPSGITQKKKMNNIGLEILFWTALTLYVLTRLGVFKR